MAMIQSSLNTKDLLFNASVAELRRKAQEHSEAMIKNLQQTQQQEKLKAEERQTKAAEEERDIAKGMQEQTSGNENPSNKHCSTSTMSGTKLSVPITSSSVSEILSAMDFPPKFHPPSYLSALTNLGFPGLPMLPDINAAQSASGGNIASPKFQSHATALLDKNNSDIIARNDDVPSAGNSSKPAASISQSTISNAASNNKILGSSALSS